MDVEREKMIRDVWRQHRNGLLPQLRRDGVVRCYPPITGEVPDKGIETGVVGGTIEILVFEAKLPRGARYLNSFPGAHDRTPGKVVCEGIELEEIP